MYTTHISAANMKVSLNYGVLVTILGIIFGDVFSPITAVDTSVSALESSDPAGLMTLSSLMPIPPVSQTKNQGYFFSLSLTSAFPADWEVTDYCLDQLRVFGQRYVTYVNCLVSSARPVKVCQNCYVSYNNLMDIYRNISSDQGPENASCHDSLMRADRLMLLYTLFTNLEGLWDTAGCAHCLGGDAESLSNDTHYFMDTLNQTLTCFEKYQLGNHSELCKSCKATYKGLNELYSRMEKNHTLCIDIEDAVNMTRHLWSKSFNCSFPREETVPVIAVSSFMLFLPIIFYLSSFLHSEQKKRKLIHPKRAKSNHSLMNIQDKSS